MKKLELPDVGKAIDDLEKPIEHQATKTDKNKEGEEDKEDNRRMFSLGFQFLTFTKYIWTT